MSKSDGEYRQERQRFVDDATLKLKHKFLGSPSGTDPVLKMMGELEQVIARIIALCKPIQQSGGALKPSDVLALRHHVFEWTLQQFDSWDKDQMIMLATTLIAERIMQGINDDPWGTGTKDVLT